jgi:hypothetical protein
MHSLIHLHQAAASRPGNRSRRALEAPDHPHPPPSPALRGALAAGLGAAARRLDRESARRAVA